MKKTIAILFAALLPLAALAQTTNQVYTNATSAITNLPAVDADNVSLGYVLVYSPTSTTFTANTTELTTNNATFVDSATNAPTYASYRLYIGGVAGTNSTWKKVR